MAIPPISPEQLTQLAESLAVPLDDQEREELDTLHALASSFIGGLDLIASLPEPERPAVPDRESHRPAPDENVLGGWVTRQLS